LAGRIVAGTLALAGLVTAFFFMFFVLLAAGAAIACLYLRALWRNRRARAEAQKDVIEGEYSVEAPAMPHLDSPFPEQNNTRQD
jgi:hypothetical protein